MTDQTNAFDGVNSYLVDYTTLWESYATKDLYMVLKTHVYFGGPTVSTSPSSGTYISAQTVTLATSSASTIYYTVDGTTPTASSTSGPSPLSLTVNSNSTLKFFASDSSNNVGPTSSASYAIIPPSTVSTSPPAGAYHGPQSVTLTASSPGTIYYKTDGSTPSTSSTSGPSPLSLTLSSNSTLKYFVKDTSNIVGSVVSSIYVIKLPLVTPMSDTMASYGLNTYSGSSIQAEYLWPTSHLIGKQIDSITIQLKKIGSPTGTVQVGVFNSDLSVKQLFGTIESSTLPTSYAQFTFSLYPLQTYQMQSGDRIGIKFTGGSSSNNVAIMSDQTNTFDGTNSYLTSYGTSWNTYTAQDLYMTLLLHVSMPTVSSSLPSGTYTNPQSVTLTASSPSIIFYTINGVIPTTSSASGPSPLSLTVNSNSTLKFFAKDASNNVGSTSTASYTITAPLTSTITKIYPDLPGGMTWNSASFSMPRTITSNTIDPVDPWLDFSHGNGNYTISNGILSASPQYSASPERIFIHNPNLQTEWNNVEITAYGRNDKMDTSFTDWTWSGLMAYARTTHGANGNENVNLCDDRGYGGRLLLNGLFNFEKETVHHKSGGYVQTADIPVWSPSKMPLNQWIGYKFIIYDRIINGTSGVQLEFWLDTNADNHWKMTDSFFDNGTNLGNPPGLNSSCATGVDPKLQLTHNIALINSETKKPHLSVYFRTDGQWMSYKDMSIREIIPPS
jgi:hypothetical protein